MSEFLLKPKDQELEKDEGQKADTQFDFLEEDLAGAAKAEGEENVEQALAEVVVGQARPDALLAWMDDLRDPEEHQQHEDDNLERSFTVDFIPDTMRDGAASDVPPQDDYMFSATVRTHAYDEGDEGGGGGGGGGGDGDGGEGGGGGDDKGKPKGANEAKKGSPDAKKPAANKPEAAKPPSKSAPSKGGKPGDK